jgi:ABC-2 type transport system ATP-binding protein
MGSNSTAMLARPGALEQAVDLAMRARDLTAVCAADGERTPRGRGDRTPLSIESVHKSYEGVMALCDVNLEVERGEILAILGLNGAGKTTLMSVISGLQRPDSGRVLLDGIERKVGSKSAKRPVGLAPQTTGVYPTLSARDNLRFFGELSGLRRRELNAQITAIAEALDLVPLLHRKARHLSGGEARRLHVGMVMICRPPILLLDEPTVGVDVANRARFIDFIKDVAADGTAICYSTHYLSEVEQLGASVAILDKGSVIAHEGVDRLIARRGTSLVELRFEGPPPHLSVDGARVHRDGTTVRIEIDGAPAEEAARIVGTLGEAGRHLRAIVLIQPSLESVFVELTGRAFVDNSHPWAA